MKSITRSPWLPWTLAAGLALAAVWLIAWDLTLRNRTLSLRIERDLAETACRMAQNQLAERSLLAEKMINDLGNKLRRSEDLSRLVISTLASPAGGAKETQVIIVWDQAQQAGLLVSEKLPAIAEMQDYQLWVFDPALAEPVNGGVFRVAADGRTVLAFKPDRPVQQAATFAISLEKKGGVSKAEGPIILSGR
jgi:hypothetical protein